MDKIQVWIYVIFAVVYFLAKFFKKKPDNLPRPKPKSPLETRTENDQRPLTFEELLKQFTGEAELQTEERLPTKEVEEVNEAETIESNAESLSNTRSFADDESRRIYEESVRMTKESDIEYEPDLHYANKKLFKGDMELGGEEDNYLVDEIKNMLTDSHDVKKAVILSEILNRKY